MFRKKILDYFDKRMSGISRLYPEALERLDSEAVHDLRVHLKRARAVFNLVEDLAPHFRARNMFKPFRSISRATRNLRDSQVQLALLARLCRRMKAGPEKFRLYLLEQESSAARVFRDSHIPDRMAILQCSREHLAATLGSLSGESALARAEARYHGLKADTLELACRSSDDERVMHELRIIAKQTHYTFEIVNSCLGRLRAEKEFVAKMRRMHGLLGDWHDHEVTFEYLDRFLKEHGSQALDIPLARLAEKLRRDKGRLVERSRMEITRIRSLVAPPPRDQAHNPTENQSSRDKNSPAGESPAEKAVIEPGMPVLGNLQALID